MGTCSCMCVEWICCVFVFCGWAGRRRRQEGPPGYRFSSAEKTLEKGECEDEDQLVVLFRTTES